MTSSKTKKFSALCSITALLMATPLPTHQVWAQQEQQQESAQTPGGNIWGAIMGITNQIAQQQMAANQQAQQMQQMQQVMQAMSFQPVPSKYFGCMVPKTLPETPVGFCEPSGGADPFQFEMMQNISQAALLKVRRYDQMLTPAQNSPTPTGLRCLEDGKTSVISSMFDRQNSLQSLIDKINKETQLFRDENARFLQKMDDLNAEIHGEGGTQTNESKTMTFANEFSPECRAIIGSTNLSPAKARQTGLTGLVEILRPQQEQASDFRSSEANTQRSFEKAKSQLADDLSSKGMADVLAELEAGAYQGAGDTTFDAINRTLAREFQSIQSKKERIEGELKELLGDDFSIPAVNRSFVEDFDRFIQGADEFYRKKFVNDCVIGRDHGFALNMDQVLRGLEHPSTNSKGRAHINYRSVLENIFSQDSYMEDKMAQIRQLDQKYDNEIKVSYRDDNGNRRRLTPYELLQKTAARCEQQYYQDETYSTKGPQVAGAGSENRAVARAKNLMNDFKNDVQDFQTGLIADIEDKFNSCEGQDVTAQSCTQEEIFSVSSPNFCMNKASQCSRRIQSCDQKAKQLVEERKAEIKVAAAQFNQNVQQLVSRQEQILSDVKQQVLEDAEFLKSQFPGADYKYPEGLFVKMPELQLRNGEMLYGGGDIDFEDLAKNVGKLKTELANQSDKIDQIVSEYINDQKNQMQENRNTLQQVADQCRSAAQQMAQAQQQQQAEQMQQQQESNAEAGDFCRKFNSLASTENPAAGCSGPYSPENLYEDVTKVSAHIDNRVSGAIGDYMALCNQSQNERKTGTEDRGERDRLSLADACKEGFSLQDRVVNQALDNIPSELESHRREIERYLLGMIDSSELSSQVKDFDNERYVMDELAILRNNIDSDRDDGKKELESFLEGDKYADIKKDIIAEYEDQVRDSNDRYCATQALIAAKKAIEESGDIQKEDNPSRIFKKEFEEQMKNRDSNYKRANRSVASTQNTGLTQRWQDIGQAVGENCAATANNSRGSSGFMDSNMGLGSDVMRNLNLSPR